MPEAIRRHRLIIFTVGALGWSWSWWLPLALGGASVGFGRWAPAYWAGVPGPLIAAALLTTITEGPSGLRRLLRLGSGWTRGVAATLALVAVAGLTVVATGGVALDRFGIASGLPDLPVVVLWLVQVLVSGLGEEPGWRGYALPALSERHRPIVATMIVSGIWALWHLPLLPVLAGFGLFTQPSMLPVFWFGLACLSVVLTWLYRNGGGVPAVVVWHGTYNVVAGTAAAQSGANVIITVAIMLAAVLIVGLGIRDGSLITRPDRTTPGPARLSS